MWSQTIGTRYVTVVFSGSFMKKQWIAAFVLGSLFWSSVPVAMAFSQPPVPGDKSVRHASPATQDHSCCPSIHFALPPRLFLIPPQPTVPCGEEHPCCARPEHENPAALPATAKNAHPFVEISAILLDSYMRPVAAAISRVRVSSSPPFDRSTVLRI